MALRSRWDMCREAVNFFGEEGHVVRIGEVTINNGSCTKRVAEGCDTLARKTVRMTSRREGVTGGSSAQCSTTLSWPDMRVLGYIHRKQNVEEEESRDNILLVGPLLGHPARRLPVTTSHEFATGPPRQLRR